MKKTSLFLMLTCGVILLGACGGGNGGGVAAATHFSVTAQGNAAAGTAFKITVTALDAANNTVATYSGMVRFTSSDPQAVLPAASTLANGTGTSRYLIRSQNSVSKSASIRIFGSKPETNSRRINP